MNIMSAQLVGMAISTQAPYMISSVQNFKADIMGIGLLLLVLVLGSVARTVGSGSIVGRPCILL